jgi:hypothetical protein
MLKRALHGLLLCESFDDQTEILGNVIPTPNFVRSEQERLTTKRKRRDRGLLDILYRIIIIEEYLPL